MFCTPGAREFLCAVSGFGRRRVGLRPTPSKSSSSHARKTSGTKGRCSETKTKFQNILQTTASVKTHINFTAPLMKKLKVQIPSSIPHSKPSFSPFYPLPFFHFSFLSFLKQTIYLHTQTAPLARAF